MRRRRIRTRLRDGAAALLACAAVSGCAGGDGTSTRSQPAFGPAAGERLAAAADRVADLLAAGDTCGAAHAADDLQDAVIEAVNAGDVPPAFQEELGTAAGELVDAVNCPEQNGPPADDDAIEDDDADKEKKKGRKEKDRRGEEDEDA